MPRIAWLLPLLLFVCPAQAANRPYHVQSCPVALVDGTNNAANCYLTNTTSGNLITLEMRAQSISAAPGNVGLTIGSPTEAFICPAGSTREDVMGGNGDEMTKLCYVFTTSSHGTFSVAITATGTSAKLWSVTLTEHVGPTVFDSGSAVGAASNSVSVTTANANEVIYAVCTDLNQSFQPGSGFSVISKANSVSDVSGSTNSRAILEQQVTTTAGSYTAGCTSNGSFPRLQIVAFAFQQNAPAVPALNVVQQCSFNEATGGTSSRGDCTLNNVVAGNKVIMALTIQGVTLFGTFVQACTETCTCVSGTFTHTTYSAQEYSTVICYVDLASSHSVFNVSMTFGGCPGCLAINFFGEEVTGLQSGADTPSGASAGATTVNYTTTAPGEWTVMIAADSPGNAAIIPGNSFPETGYNQRTSDTPVITGGLLASKITIASGSNTASFSVAGSSAPVIAVLSFAPTPTGFRNKFKIL